MGSWPRGAVHRHRAALSRQLPHGEPGSAVPQFPASLSGPSGQGMCWDALKAGVIGVLQTLQAGVCVGGFGGYWWGALGLTLPPFPCRAGGVCALISNTRFSQAVKSSFPNVNNTLDNIHTYLASIPQARMVPLPCLGGKGPGGRSSPNRPLGKGSRGVGSRERSPPSLTPHLRPYSKLILSSTRAMSRWTMPTAACRTLGPNWAV